MTPIELYLTQKVKENNFDYQRYIYSIYEFISNDDLRKLLAIYHTQLNKWFDVINKSIHNEYDEAGKQVYTEGYLRAQDSRDLLEIIDGLEQLMEMCNLTEYEFQLCNNGYISAIESCKKLVAKRWGSTIPATFQPVRIAEIVPIFHTVNSHKITYSAKVIRAKIKLIGEGSYAKVFSYIDPIYSFPVVLKRARKDLSNKELERFKQEFEVLKGLHSPYIVEVYSYDDKLHEYTMERMDETIYSFIEKNNTKITMRKRKSIIYQIVQGLDCIHKKGYLHRDISLKNVFIKHYDNDVDVVKIGDFGLVKNPESTLTDLQSNVKGSLNDPDLINVGFSEYAMCHEIFALTRLCFFILTGKENIDRQKNGAIKEFWRCGTNPDTSKRFQSLVELRNAVKSIPDEK